MCVEIKSQGITMLENNIIYKCAYAVLGIIPANPCKGSINLSVHIYFGPKGKVICVKSESRALGTGRKINAADGKWKTFVL